MFIQLIWLYRLMAMGNGGLKGYFVLVYKKVHILLAIYISSQMASYFTQLRSNEKVFTIQR